MGSGKERAAWPWWGGLVVAAAGVLGPLWLWTRRRRYAGIARGLTPGERGAMHAYFRDAVLHAARVAVVERMENPLAVRLLLALGLGRPLDLDGVRGMCFGDLVAVTRGAMEERGLSTLFHELVHSVQVRRVGARPFCRAYAADYLRYGYALVRFEEEAFGLQGRFERGEVFKVE